LPAVDLHVAANNVNNHFGAQADRNLPQSAHAAAPFLMQDLFSLYGRIVAGERLAASPEGYFSAGAAITGAAPPLHSYLRRRHLFITALTGYS